MCKTAYYFRPRDYCNQIFFGEGKYLISHSGSPTFHPPNSIKYLILLVIPKFFPIPAIGVVAQVMLLRLGFWGLLDSVLSLINTDLKRRKAMTSITLRLASHLSGLVSLYLLILPLLSKFCTCKIL